MNQQTLLHHTILSKQELLDIVEDYQTSPDGSREKQKALDSIIKYNYKLVYKIAAKIYNQRHLKTLELQDLVNAGLEALIKTANRFDLTSGNCFSTYAYFWIVAHINRAIQKEEDIIRRPCHVLDLFSRIKKESVSYKLKHGKYPTREYLANALGITVPRVQNCLDAMNQRLCSLNKQVNSPSGADNTELVDLVENPNDETDIVFKEELQNLVFECLDILTEREREIMLLRHGLDGSKEIKSLAAIGKMMNLSRERIRQLEYSANRKLKADSSLRELFDLYICKD